MAIHKEHKNKAAPSSTAALCETAAHVRCLAASLVLLCLLCASAVNGFCAATAVGITAPSPGNVPKARSNGHIDSGWLNFGVVTPQDKGAKGDGVTDDTAAIQAAFNAGARQSVVFPAAAYYCANPSLSTVIPVNAASVDARGATFLNCMFSTASATGGMEWVGGAFNTTAIQGSGKGPIFQVSQNHTSFIDTRWTYTANYTAIQIGGGSGVAAPDDINIDGIWTSPVVTHESHITVTGGSNIRINNWAQEGLFESGLALLPLSGAIQGVTATNVTASNVNNILQIAGNNAYPVSNVILNGFTCDQCQTPLNIATIYAGGAQPITNVLMTNGTVTDAAGTQMVNLASILDSIGVNITNLELSHIKAVGQFNNTSGEAQWKWFNSTGGAVYSHFTLDDLTLVSTTATKTSSAGSGPISGISGQNNKPWIDFKFNNIDESGGYYGCLNFVALMFATREDLQVTNSKFSNCQDYATRQTVAANAINNRAVWINNTTTLYTGQPELGAVATSAPPASITFEELSTPAPHVYGGTYVSGVTATGSAGQTCTLGSFNGGGSAAAATVALTGTNTIGAGAYITVTNTGTGYTSAPTAATAGNGTAACSGTAVVAMTTDTKDYTGITPGTSIFCSDCAMANPCTGSGTGALAKRINGAWVCN